MDKYNIFYKNYVVFRKTLKAGFHNRVDARRPLLMPGIDQNNDDFE